MNKLDKLNPGIQETDLTNNTYINITQNNWKRSNYRKSANRWIVLKFNLVKIYINQRNLIINKQYIAFINSI